MTKRVVAALILNQEGKILVCQRTRHQVMPMKWEFPGGKIEPGEQPRDALHRELEEELGIDAAIGEEVARIHHVYKGGGAVELRFYVVHKYHGELENRIFRDIQWADRTFPGTTSWKQIWSWSEVLPRARLSDPRPRIALVRIRSITTF
jgi:8-oxo-dGTP diphosphatase